MTIDPEKNKQQTSTLTFAEVGIIELLGFVIGKSHGNSYHLHVDIWVFPKIGVKPPKWMVNIMTLFFNG